MSYAFHGRGFIVEKKWGGSGNVRFHVHPGMAPVGNQAFVIHLFRLQVVHKFHRALVQKIVASHAHPQQFKLLVGLIGFADDLTDSYASISSGDRYEL